MSAPLTPSLSPSPNEFQFAVTDRYGFQPGFRRLRGEAREGSGIYRVSRTWTREIASSRLCRVGLGYPQVGSRDEGPKQVG